MADLEGALKKLDRLTQEEARMALAEVLRITDNIRDGVKVVDEKVENVGDKVADVGDKVEDVGDKVEDIGDKVQCVNEKVQVIIDGTRGWSRRSLIPSNIFNSRWQASKRRGEGNKIDYSTRRKSLRRNRVFVIPTRRCSLLVLKPTHRDPIKGATPSVALSR